jgi:hypothetical protein
MGGLGFRMLKCDDEINLAAAANCTKAWKLKKRRCGQRVVDSSKLGRRFSWAGVGFGEALLVLLIAFGTFSRS